MTKTTKIITFLGDRGPLETTYLHQGQPYTGGVFAEALRQFCDYHVMLVCVTEAARKKTWPHLEQLRDERIKPIDIPTGRNHQEMWATFNLVTDHINEEDNVIFDITHGLRSLPFLVFLFAAYLKSAKNITIEAVYYGALELKDRENNGPAPVIDLSEFVSIIDWLTATDQFLKTGNGNDLAELLKEAGGHTEALGNRILEISQGLQLLRPMDVMIAADALPQDIEQAKPDLATVVPPFEMLLNRVLEEYGQFALAEPKDYQMNGKVALQKQLFEIEWYAKKGLDVQALSLAREWLPSLLCHHFNLDPMDNKVREEMEILCCGGKRGDRESIYRGQYKEIPKSQRKVISQLWNDPPCTLANLRNDVLHSGFRKKPKSVREIKQTLRQVIDKLNEIASLWGIID